MTTISATTLNPYLPSSPNISLKGAAETPASATSPTVSLGITEEKDDDKLPEATGVSSGGSNKETIDELKKQIEQTEKLLAQQQAQLARIQNSRMAEEQKSQQAMALQNQIMGTQATLMTLRGALLQAMTVSIDTHA
ncbi:MULTISPECIES: hypothetical protein [Pseudomonas]|uniref:Uncharacterized protein n=1 Tax=Pseudomonas fluorescens (strain Q2-87) TaxID=1038922 RepID=J2EGD7_PSEFQ|nr:MULTISPECIES: hypothetical protein [Pseudomonas]EJL02440.1 hypothetical protein PflQ2_4477 [Pseudomonas fluorescens Q2-87]